MEVKKGFFGEGFILNSFNGMYNNFLHGYYIYGCCAY